MSCKVPTVQSAETSSAAGPAPGPWLIQHVERCACVKDERHDPVS